MDCCQQHRTASDFQIRTNIPDVQTGHEDTVTLFMFLFEPAMSGQIVDV